MLLLPNGRRPERRPPPKRGPRGNIAVATVVSCVPDVAYPWDPRVVRAIRRDFDPHFVPCFVKKISKSQAGGEIVQQYHGLAMGSSTPGLNESIQPWVYQALQPIVTQSMAGRTLRPTRMHFQLFHRDAHAKPIPGVMVPFDWLVYKGLISMRDDMTKEQRQAFLEQHAEELATEKARLEAEERVAYQEKADAGWLAKHVDAFDVTDRARLGAGVLDTAPATRPSVYVGKNRPRRIA